MQQVRSLIFSSLWLVALGMGMFCQTARADEYADVTQLVRAGKLSAALVKADAFLATQPRDPQMRFFKGVIQRDSGDPQEAMTTFAQLTQDYPELPEPYNNLAVLYAGQNQLDKARSALEMAIRINPGYATAHENLGDVYAKLASQSYSKAAELAPAGQATLGPKLTLIRQLLKSPVSGPCKMSDGACPKAN
jgi:tetratricopeptide (TPR) repeat protein